MAKHYPGSDLLDKKVMKPLQHGLAKKYADALYGNTKLGGDVLPKKVSTTELAPGKKKLVRKLTYTKGSGRPD